MMATRSAMRNIDPSDSIIVRRGGAAQTNYDIRYYIHRFSTRTVLFWYYNYEALGIRIPMHQVRYGTCGILTWICTTTAVEVWIIHNHE